MAAAASGTWEVRRWMSQSTSSSRIMAVSRSVERNLSRTVCQLFEDIWRLGFVGLGMQRGGVRCCSTMLERLDVPSRLVLSLSLFENPWGSGRPRDQRRSILVGPGW